MQVSTAIAIYFLIWWLTLFAVLPFGVRSQHETGEVAPGSDPGAPAIPALGKKLIWTTIVATALFAAFYYSYSRQLVSLQDLATLFGLLH
jgi:predicted secreted protein